MKTIMPSKTRIIAFLLGAVFIYRGWQIKTHKDMPLYFANEQSGGFELAVMTISGIVLIIYSIFMKQKK